MEIRMGMDADKLKQIALSIGGQLMAFAKEAGKARGIVGLWALRFKAIELVEEAKYAHKLIGSDCKEIAVLAILAAVPDRWVPDAAIKPFVSMAVEWAYTSYKNKNAKSGL